MLVAQKASNYDTEIQQGTTTMSATTEEELACAALISSFIKKCHIQEAAHT
jgi:hypothetical protein